MSLKFAVIGTGALGGFYGGMLARAGNDVHFLLNRDFLHVKENGLKIQSDIHGTFVIPNINTYNDINTMPVCDVILVCLKTTQNALVSNLSHISHKGTMVIMIQNGLGVEDDAASMLPGSSIVGGLAFIGANKIGAGHIHHLEHGTLRLGDFNVKNPAYLNNTIQAFQNAGIETIYTDKLDYIRWQKLIWNMAFNGTCVVLNTTTDKLLENPQTRKMLYDLMTETVEGAQACGIPLEMELVEENIRVTDKFQSYKPSMKLDYDNGREMELKYIYEKPIQYAEKAGYKMMKMKILLQQLYFIQQQIIQGK